jgi:signal transduction histidine kinase
VAVRSAFRSLWDEPKAPNPPARVWRDWVLVAVLLPTAVLEGVFRPDVVWRPFALVVAVVVVLALLWRRTHPLAMVAVTFGGWIVIDLVSLLTVREPIGLFTSACVLVIGYAVVRWGSGREIVIGLALMLTAGALGIAVDWTGVVEAFFGSLVLLMPALLGASVRYWTTARGRELDQIKLREREQLARELHDTVAHHVSAITIRAQAGQVVAASDPSAAVDALRVIEQEAVRTLGEMRTIVGVLRRGEAADLVPQQGVSDIERLGATDHGPRVDVTMTGDLDDLAPSLGAALYRIAQEAVTNAMRHARHATRVDVRVVGDDDCVRLTVRDDGDTAASGRGPDGYGLIGMAERATLLGGTLVAGPGNGRGWSVDVVLPRAVPVA